VRRRGFARSLRQRPQLFVALALASAALAGCTTGPSMRPEVVVNDGPSPKQPSSSAANVPLPPIEEPKSPTIKWTDCDADTRNRLGQPAVAANLRFSCAKVPTTLDAPDLPNRGMARISVLKVGSGPIPLVVVNDVDGDPGTLFAARLAATVPPELLQRFSLVGVDRRGTGQSMPAQCIPGGVRQDLVGQDPGTDSIDAVLDAARKAGQQCAIELDSSQHALDSWRAAGDLDQLRQQLGMSRLNALGHGEGSKVLSEYAVRYTAQVGRFVLDGVPDPGADTAAVLDAVAAGLQSTVDAFGADCASRSCSLGSDARAAITGLTDKLRTSPLTTEYGDQIGPGLALYAVAAGLAQRTRWPELADAITAARAGDASKLTVFAAPLVQDTRLQPSRLDGTIATKCNDSATRLPADQLGQIAKNMRDKYSAFGGLVAQQLAWCSPWPVRRESLPAGGAPGAPPILVASTETDPVTPGLGTTRAADQMPSAVKIAWQGAGHGAFGVSPCITDAVRRFLIDGKIPNDGTLCPS
jgi:pimeloyl-ACP methyl ester carboxylesterase